MTSGSLTDSLRETLAVFEESGNPHTTTEVAERLGLGRRSTYERLERLVEQGQLETKKVGASGRVWWRPQSAVNDAATPVTGTTPVTESVVYDALDAAEVGVFVLDADFDVAWLNDAAERYFGLDRERVLGRDKRELVDEQIAATIDDSHSFAETVLATYDDNTDTEQFECRVTAGEGREARWLEHRSEPIDTGTYAGGRIELYYDISEQKRREQTERENRDQFTSLVETVEEYAIFLLDSEGYIRTWNPGAEQIKGYTSDEAIGEHFSMFYTEDDRTAGVPEQNLRRARNEGSIEDEGWRVRADGSRFWASVTITPLYDEGTLTGYAKVIRDMTDRREREQAIRQEHALLENVLETSPVGILVLDPEGMIDRTNERAEELLGFAASEMEGRFYGELDWDLWDESGDSIPLDDHPVSRAFATGSRVLGYDHGITLPDGTDRWLSTDVAPISDEAGEVKRVVVTIEDVTQLREQTRRLERQRDEFESKLEDVFDRISDGFYGLDENLRFTYINAQTKALLGVEESEAVGREIQEVIELTDEFEAVLHKAMEDQAPVFWEEYYELFDSWFQSAIYPSESGLSVYFRDITEQKACEQQLEQYKALTEAARDVIVTIDDTSTIHWVNPAVEDVFGYEPGELEGEPLTVLMPEPYREGHLAAIQRYLETGQRSLDWNYVEVPGRTKSGDEIPLAVSFSEAESNGNRFFTGVIRDISERKEYERELEEYRRWTQTLVENFPSGAVALVDEDLRYVTFAGVPEGDWDLTRTDLEGSSVPDALPQELADVVVPGYEAALDGGSVEFEDTIDGRIYQYHFVPVRDDDGEVFAATAMSQDITEQKEREQDLRDAKLQLEAATEAGEIGTWEWHIPDDTLTAGALFARTFGLDTEDVREGIPLDRFTSSIHEDDRERVEQQIEAAVESCSEYEAEYRVRNADGEVRWVVARGHVECDEEGNPATFPGALVDITERKERERELQARIRQQEVVAEFGLRALEDRDVDALMAEAAGLVADTLDNDYCKVLDLDADAEELLLRQGVGWKEGIVGSATISAVEESSQAAYTLATDQPVVVRDLETESRFSGPELLTSHDVRSGVSTIIGTRDEPWGILGTHDTSVKEFSGHDVNFVQSMANILSSAIARHRNERMLERQHEQLVALNTLNDVVHDITDAVIEQSTREEIEQIVCERLAATDSYEFAWIGDVDSRTQTVTLRTEAGVEGYLDDMTISVDPDDQRSRGATGRAILEGEIQTTEDILENPDYEQWREYIREYDVRSSAAIPITHEGTVYGALNVYADRPNAFTGEERAVLGQLGEIVGHAIASIQRKQALMSDQVVELDFRIADVFDALDVPVSVEDEITLEQTVAAGDDTYLTYGTATEESIAAIEALVASDEVPHWQSMEIIETDDDVKRFVVRLVGPPVLSAITSAGGYVHKAGIEDGDYYMTLHVAPSADVSRVIEIVRDAYPTAQLVTKQQITREDVSESEIDRLLEANLTDRQRSALRAAFYAGYFDWPRETTGEDVAESLGVSSPTFHQHLRKALHTVLATVLNDQEPIPDSGEREAA